MRQEALTVIKAGLSRQRLKGGALRDSLFDLLNAYVTTEKTIRSRPGTSRHATLPAGTKGLVHHNDSFHVFASDVIGGIPVGYTLNVVRAPDGAALSRIHFAEPFLDRLYVSAEFADGDIYHFYIQPPETWQPTTEYALSDVVEPTVPNGFKYTPSRAATPNPAWTANVERTVGDRVDPLNYNGYFFEAVRVSGTTPRSGETEPGWATDSNIIAGKRYVESGDGDFNTPDATEPGAPGVPPLPGEDRYGPKRSELDELDLVR